VSRFNEISNRARSIGAVSKPEIAPLISGRLSKQLLDSRLLNQGLRRIGKFGKFGKFGKE
jgi:hypothetical protein